MARIITVPPIPGVKDLFTLLEFLNDKDRVADRIKEMENVREEINSLVEKAGKADQIESLLGQASQNRSQAAEVLKTANEEAEVTRKQSKQMLDKAKAESNILFKTVEESRKSIKEWHDTESEKFRKLQEFLKAATTKIEERERAAAQLLQESTAIKAEFEEKISRLRAAGVG